ncbi:MAG TPA: hemerythrin domain-containing protein [bacterium]
MTNLSILEQTRRDHEILNQEMGKLKIIIWQEIADRDFADWRLDCMWQLRDFRNCLLKHFDLEEEGGFMVDLLRVAAHEEHKINELKNEHDKMIALLDEILNSFKELQAKDSARLEKSRTSVNELIQMLRKHENEEHNLLQRTYYREYGGPA